jgi:hypothetical protein
LPSSLIDWHGASIHSIPQVPTNMWDTYQAVSMEGGR